MDDESGECTVVRLKRTRADRTTCSVFSADDGRKRLQYRQK